MIRLMQIIQCNKSEHWFFTLAKQKSPVRKPSFLYYSNDWFPVFSPPTLTETIPLCYDMGSRKGKQSGVVSRPHKNISSRFVTCIKTSIRSIDNIQGEAEIARHRLVFV